MMTQYGLFVTDWSVEDTCIPDWYAQKIGRDEHENMGVWCLVFGVTLLSATSVYASESFVSQETYQTPAKEYSPYLDDHYPQNVYFGDTHLHTSWSTDAGMVGAKLGPFQSAPIVHPFGIHPK